MNTQNERLFDLMDGQSGEEWPYVNLKPDWDSIFDDMESELDVSDEEFGHMQAGVYHIPVLTLDLLRIGVSRNDYYHHHVITVLQENEFRNLGWANNSKEYDTIQEMKRLGVSFEEAYRNDSGSYCIEVSFDDKMYYCVDMGD